MITLKNTGHFETNEWFLGDLKTAMMLIQAVYEDAIRSSKGTHAAYVNEKLSRVINIVTPINEIAKQYLDSNPDS